MTANDAMTVLLERMHGLVETACHHWRSSMPSPSPDESAATRQDRATAHDLLREADAILRSAKR